ncbi:GDYXXLXY domain-containing protein [Brevibacillus dissolubilis]|uniref:GDYXXLXY domain-containing protein n=1 Tax=Brevibacillus dissolubilis TaxID=1844116 RepID=UPI0011171820|nr:GDYXXLXY domain-containing protein [Brevibacillus dissolubilis]
MMQKLKSIRLWLIVALQLVILFSIVGKYHYIEANGQVVLLKTAPIDPTDLFYGDYVIIGYEIQEIDKKTVIDDEIKALTKGQDYFDRATQVYVVLEKKQNPWHEAVGIYLNKPELKPNQAVLKGTIQYVGATDEAYFVNYGGIDRYYVPENTGREIEDNRDMYNQVELRTSGNGDAVIVQLHKQTSKK